MHGTTIFNMYENDRQIASKLVAGDQRAFDAFFNTYFPRLYRFALIRLDDNADRAEDVAQATLCKAVTKMHTYRGEAALFTWLCTFCRHEISALVKKERLNVEHKAVRDDDPEVRAALESLSWVASTDPELAMGAHELSRLVRQTLDYLPSLYGDVLEMKYIHGLPVKEIASRLGKGPKAIESLLTRARESFRDGFRSLVGMGPDYLADSGR
jgi:RNA polymerase sigma-70 factor (ECF subfamily)